MTPIDNSTNPLAPLTQEQLLQQEILMGIGTGPSSSTTSSATSQLEQELYDTGNTTSVTSTTSTTNPNSSSSSAVATLNALTSSASTSNQEAIDADFKHKRRHLVNLSDQGKL